MKLIVLSVCCVLLVARVQCGCAEDLVQDPAFQACQKGMSTYAMAAVSDPTAMCSEEARAGMACYFEYLKECPELGAEGSLTPEMMEQNCGAMSALKECEPIVQCVQAAMPSEGGLPTPSFDLTKADVPFVALPYFVGVLCGPVKETLTCLEGAEEKCPMLVEVAKNSTDMMEAAAAKQKLRFPNDNEVKMLVKNQCMNLPAGFASDSCISGQLASKDYLDCQAEVKTNFTAAKHTCDSYSAVTMCLKTAMVPTCSKEKYEAMLSFAKYFILDVPTDCEISSTSGLQASIITLLLVAVISRFF